MLAFFKPSLLHLFLCLSLLEELFHSIPCPAAAKRKRGNIKQKSWNGKRESPNLYPLQVYSSFLTSCMFCAADREIDIDEFKKVMALMRSHNRQGSLHSDGLRAGHSVGGSVENGGLVEYFFGKDGKKCLHHDKFVQFLRDLQNEMLRLEFAHYDYKKQGTVSAKDFALSMVASADLKHLNKLLDRVDDLDNIPHLSNICITPEEFKNFAELRKKLQPFSLALFSFGKVNGLLTRKDFKRAASQVCGVSLTDNVIEIIFHVFDANRDGSLSADEFVRVLQKRERDIARPTEAGIFGFLSCCWNCTNSCSVASVFSVLS